MKIGCQPACPVIPGHTKPSSQEELVIYYVQLGISLLADTGVQSQLRLDHSLYWREASYSSFEQSQAV